MKTVIISVLSALLIGGLIYFGPEIREHFGTRYADADREVFENSKPFVHGQIENLQRMKLKYEMAENDEHRDAIRVSVLSQTANLDKSRLPYDLQQWVNSL